MNNFKKVLSKKKKKINILTSFLISHKSIIKYLEIYDNYGIHSIKKFGAKQPTPKYNLVLAILIIKFVSFS